jgi:lysophospholipase L1-like esterase
MKKLSARALAAVATLALAACNGGNNVATPQSAGGAGLTVASPPQRILAQIVGIGDSLTAGEQSNGLLGANITPNPLGGPFPSVQATQTHGAWALFWSQANNGADVTTAATSPLPLIKAPGIGGVLVPTAAGSLAPIQVDCTGPNNALAFSFGTALQTRLAPTQPLDLGVPGQTLHEAIYQTGPNSPCVSNSGSPLDAIAGIVRAENENFYPVLGTFPQNTSQLDAALSLHPTLTTVWLGANDVLKYMFTNGAVAITDQGQFRADLTQIVQRLQAAGSKVVLLNLPNIPGAAQFTPTNPPVLAQYLGSQLLPAGVPAATVGQISAGVSQILAAQYTLGTNGLLTQTGFGKVLVAIQTTLKTGAPLTIALNPAGDFVLDAVAQNAAANNAAYNTIIASVASSNGAALADVATLFTQASTTGLPVNPPKCCNALFGGGLFSLDGLHPSNTGYALIANLMINATNAAYGTTIAPANVGAIYAADPYAPH